MCTVPSQHQMWHFEIEVLQLNLSFWRSFWWKNEGHQNFCLWAEKYWTLDCLTVWSLTDWFWCICRFIGGTVQIEVITLSWAKQTLLRDWFIFSCSEGRFKVSWGEAAESTWTLQCYFCSPLHLFYCIFTRAFWKWDALSSVVMNFYCFQALQILVCFLSKTCA